jgi:bleomycin hydrolase
MVSKKTAQKRQREETQNNSKNECVKKIDVSENINSIVPEKITKFKDEFYNNQTNKIFQNALCSNSLWQISEVRKYMQSRDTHFSHILEPRLTVSNQGLSGRCWLFAVLNVMRHPFIAKFQLPYNFEFSESYLSFYEKIEKCNYILTEFIKKGDINSHDLKNQNLLLGGCEDGGHWVTCANLIRKYGIIPKSCFKESVHSFDTSEINEILGYKIKEYSLMLIKEKDKQKQYEMKDKMISEIYSILAKMLGTPPTVDEKIEWTFLLRLDLSDRLEREAKRKESNGEFETIQIKQTIQASPREFYQKLVTHDLNDYYRFSNDPRNDYHNYYQSFDEDMVVGGERNGFYNLPIDDIVELCVKSIKENTPVEFDCDVTQYMHPVHRLLDTKCFDHGLVFGLSFNELSKKERLEVLESYANHAMVLTGVDILDDGTVLKFKVENSWGRSYTDEISEEDDEYYTMTLDWFKNFVYNVVIHKSFVAKHLQNKYNKAKQTPVTLPENDIMA